MSGPDQRSLGANGRIASCVLLVRLWRVGVRLYLQTMITCDTAVQRALAWATMLLLHGIAVRYRSYVGFAMAVWTSRCEISRRNSLDDQVAE